MAPARDLDPAVRQQLLADAVRFAEAIGYVNAGTVEFLVEPSGRHVFIEMNPRIQVEHTVTEEVTDIDLVESQLRIAAGATLDDLGLSQNRISMRGFAMQCRVTAENPANDFRPDTGRIVAYRPASGAGVRLDGCVYQGVEITPHFDSMIEKITCRGPDFDTVVGACSAPWPSTGCGAYRPISRTCRRSWPTHSSSPNPSPPPSSTIGPS